jgi:arylsulfatase A-like enzyme
MSIASSAYTRRQLFGLTTGAVFAARSALHAAPAARRPNIVIILADDQGWGDLSIHGNTNLSTPNIDSLARDGALFEHFYVCAVCAPTRAEFLTGRYHARGGVRGVSTGAERLNTDQKTIADTFRASGYATGAFGKWHNGTQHPYHPNARGFDEYYGFTSGHWGSYFNPELDHNGQIVHGKGYITDDLTNHALDFIGKNRAKPFFCYLPLNTPHSPMQVPGKYYDKFAALEPKLRARDPRQEDIGMTRAALAMCENIDWNVGRILDKLKELKLAEDTVVIYFSDNGPNSWRWNGGMKGRKGSVDEGGVRAPLLIRWPGHIRPGQRITPIAAAIDLLPTLARLADVPLIETRPLDGRSLVPLLTGHAEGWPARMIFSLQGKRISVRTQQYRLDPDGHLFDMLADPGQDHDVATAHPDIAMKLREAVAKWGREMLPLVGPDDRPFTVGYARSTMLPARDGVPHGKIARSAKPPNCSFFTAWSDTASTMTWDIEVHEAGLYNVELWYTCPATDTGSTIELSFGESRVTGRIQPAWDPPLLGKENDRTPRVESYVKDFHPLALGRIRLPKGRGLLTLRALSVTGREVADVRRIMLTR